MQTFKLAILCFVIGISGYSQTEFQLDSLYQYSWDLGIPGWDHDVTEKNTFANGGTKETKVLGFLSNGVTFNMSYQFDKTYNANNDITLNERDTWNSGTMMWDSASRETSTYDGSNRITKLTTEFYNGSTWTAFEEYTYAYDGSGNLTEEIYKTFNGMMLVNSTRILLDYTGSLISVQTNQNWDGANWQNEEKQDIMYENDLPTLAEYSLWNGSTWDLPYERDTAMYDANDLLMEILTETYNGSTWDKSELSTLMYENGRVTEFLEQTWDGSIWVNEARETNAYDTDGNNIEIIFDDWDGSNWVGNFRQTRYYSPASPLSSPSFEASSIKAFPNPVIDVFNIKLKAPLTDAVEASLYSLNGKLLTTIDMENGQDNFQINMEALKQGMYLLRLNGIKSHTLRIVKK